MANTVCQLREETLKRAVLAGDETAWRLWYDETFDAVQRFVIWRLRGNSDRCDEVLQETWLIAVKRIREFDPQRGAFLDWVRGISANVLKNHIRKSQSIPTKPLTDDVAVSIEVPGSSAASQSERIVAVLQFLPGRYAEVLKQKYLEQKSVAEIAASWNETTKAVESLLTRARHAFREAFGVDQTAK